MKLLLDTHVLLWAAGEPARLSASARRLISDTNNEPLFSVASLWEIAIKRGLGRKDFESMHDFFAAGYWTTVIANCPS